MLKLSMTSLRYDEPPPIPVEHLYHVPNLHRLRVSYDPDTSVSTHSDSIRIGKTELQSLFTTRTTPTPSPPAFIVTRYTPAAAIPPASS